MVPPCTDAEPRLPARAPLRSHSSVSGGGWTGPAAHRARLGHLHPTHYLSLCLSRLSWVGGISPERFVGRQCAVLHAGWVLFLLNFICTSRKVFFLPSHRLSLPSRAGANLRFLPLCCPGVGGQVGEGVAFALPWASRCLVLGCLPESTGFPRCTQSTERPVCKGESVPPGKTDVQFS